MCLPTTTTRARSNLGSMEKLWSGTERACRESELPSTEKVIFVCLFRLDSFDMQYTIYTI